jgi:hypothetical protein
VPVPYRRRLLLLVAAGVVAGSAAGRPLVAQQPLSHIPFCSSDSSAGAFVEQIRFRVAGTDSASRKAQAAIGLVALGAEEVSLVVDDGVCLAASTAYASHGGTPGGMPAPFPVAVVRAGDRYVVRLPDPHPARGGEPRTLVFDSRFEPVGSYGAEP